MTEEQREKRRRGLALFDFDGTLIPWDTQALFADFVVRREGRRRAYLACFAALAPACRILGDEGMKRVFLSYLWRAEPRQIAAWAREFAETELRPRLFPEVVARLDAHREAGEMTVLASASPEWYVREIGRMLGFDLALGTVVEVGPRMRLFPDLRNHKGAAKVARLAARLGEPADGRWPGTHGYTDSVADLPMMAVCESGTVVNPSPRLRELAAANGWETIRQPVPWKGKIDKTWRILRFAAGI